MNKKRLQELAGIKNEIKINIPYVNYIDKEEINSFLNPLKYPELHSNTKECYNNNIKDINNDLREMYEEIEEGEEESYKKFIICLNTIMVLSSYYMPYFIENLINNKFTIIDEDEIISPYNEEPNNCYDIIDNFWYTDLDSDEMENIGAKMEAYLT